MAATLGTTANFTMGSIYLRQGVGTLTTIYQYTALNPTNGSVSVLGIYMNTSKTVQVSSGTETFSLGLRYFLFSLVPGITATVKLVESDNTYFEATRIG